MFGITVEVCNIPLLRPRDGDGWIMMIFKRVGYSTDNLCQLNKLWVHEQVLFLSYVLVASVKSLVGKYLKQRGVGEKWSTFRFPKKRPPHKDFRLWKQAITQVILEGRIIDRLVSFKEPGHKVWELILNNYKMRLLHIKGEVVDIYKQSRVRNYATTSKRWT